MRTATIPVTLVTGFLGAGKTTLMNHLGATGGLTDTLVVINEFGQVGLDHLLMIEAKDELVVELSDGCVCCTLHGDLTRALLDALEQRRLADRRPFERVVIETSGVSDPSSIAKALAVDPALHDVFHLEAVVALVDAASGRENLEKFHEAAAQVAVADLILVTKCDAAESNVTSALHADLGIRNPFARIQEIEHGRIASTAIFDPELKLRRPLLQLPALALEVPQPVSPFLGMLGGIGVPGAPQPAHGGRYQVMGFESNAPVSRSALQAWLSTVAALLGSQILRYKAILNVEAETAPLVLHGVQGVISPEAWLEEWPEGHRASRMVLITEKIAQPIIQAGLDAFFPNAFKPALSSSERPQ
ncbi:GTP-binding protein [Stenotrophomonas sp. S39]|uniref:CobW family GTP-binding protein n=1 Tax=Stenotrophomonas sp. S39 TaxID=2767451 RepID=UPI00190BD696|nr:GTP-binding protein [Stenotrophomonas sp. S39]MBK0052695.1 GTP-binding protein [Stenotrophomonas sp. S39]